MWELAEHRWLVVERGIEPVKWETYPDEVRKAVFRDADGNEIGFGFGFGFGFAHL